ncbi:aspartyl protease family protein [Photobacterium indicum]|uniref:aspartyl protease family protein n=1 Tax=Photobacterium indicum TaxID=81447 RepID=UPI003D0A564F
MIPPKKNILLVMTFLPLHAFADDLLLGHPDATQYSVTLPFELINNGIFVDIPIDKQHYRFLLDTGAPTLVSPKFVQQKKLVASNNKIEYTDANGVSGKIPMYHMPDIKLDNVTFSGYVTPIFEGLDYPPFSCYNASGLIGYNTLRESVLNLDFVNSELTISDSAPKNLEKKGYYPAGFYFNGHDGPLLTLWHEFGNMDIILDTGSNGGVSLNSPSLSQTLIEEDYKGKTIKGSSTNFTISGSKARKAGGMYDLRNLSIGKLNVDNFPVTVKEDEVRSLIGIQFLKQYNVVIDFKSSVAWFKPNGVDAAASNYPVFGVYPTPQDNTTVVEAVLEESKADLAGVAVGDQIVKMNGSDTTNLNLSEQCDLFMSDNFDSYTIKTESGIVTLSN